MGYGPLDWTREPAAAAALQTQVAAGASLLHTADDTLDQVAVRRSRDTKRVGALRTLWSHRRPNLAVRQAAVRQTLISAAAVIVIIGLLYAVLRWMAAANLSAEADHLSSEVTSFVTNIRAA